MRKLTNLGLLLLSLTVHISLIGFIFFALLTITNWYLQKIPLLGVDLHNTITYVSYLKRHFMLPVNGFKDIWFTGVPLYKDTLLLHYYFILPLTQFFSVLDAVRYYVVGSIFAFGIFTYLLLFRLSKNHLVAAGITLLTLFSSGYYGSLVWGGSLPYFSTQPFLPLVILLLVMYLQTGNRGWFAAAALATGGAFTGLPLLTGTFIIPIWIKFY
ncbi:MAG: hypothetical protein AAB874_05225 [Patescibacteria group bacterium]